VNSLYFVEAKVDGNSFYKIGITTRLIEERIAEMQRDVISIPVALLMMLTVDC